MSIYYVIMKSIKLVKLVEREMLEVKGGSGRCLCNGSDLDACMKKEGGDGDRLYEEHQ